MDGLLYDGIKIFDDDDHQTAKIMLSANCSKLMASNIDVMQPGHHQQNLITSTVGGLGCVF